jgi:purine-binding chemotaxis protein CheW
MEGWYDRAYGRIGGTLMTLLVGLQLDDRRYALPLAVVQRITRVVEIMPLPDAPRVIGGVINVHGRIVAVVNIRERFALPERALRLTDQLLIAQTPRQTIALMVDAVLGVIECAESDIVAASAVAPGMQCICGIAKLADGMILIHDLDRLLSMDELQAVDDVMSGA